MKILVISNLYPPDVIGGYELCCCQATEALRHRGHDMLVLTSAPRTPCAPQPGVLRGFKLANYFGINSETVAAHQGWRRLEAESLYINAFNVHALTRALDEFRPDVVYLWNLIGLGGLSLIGCLALLGVPWLWCLGDDVPRQLCSRAGKTVPTLAREYSRTVCGSYLAVSRRVVDEIESAGIELRGRLEIMPNWVIGAPPPERKRYYQQGQLLRILYAGQIGPHKGTDVLALAALRLRKAGYDRFSIDLFGELQHPQFPARLRQLGLADHVRLLGQVSQNELFALYRQEQYDVFAFPTWKREPFGCAPLEAAAHGTVMAISQDCGIGEWFVGGVHCLKVERTAAAWSRLFEAILIGAVSLAPVARRGAAVIWRDFHVNALMPRIERALHEAASLVRSRRATSADAYRLVLCAEHLVERFLAEERN